MIEWVCNLFNLDSFACLIRPCILWAYPWSLFLLPPFAAENPTSDCPKHLVRSLFNLLFASLYTCKDTDCLLDAEPRTRRRCTKLPKRPQILAEPIISAATRPASLCLLLIWHPNRTNWKDRWLFYHFATNLGALLKHVDFLNKFKNIRNNIIK